VKLVFGVMVIFFSKNNHTIDKLKMLMYDLIKDNQFKTVIIKNSDGGKIKEKQFKKLIIKNSDGDLIKDNQFKNLL